MIIVDQNRNMLININNVSCIDVSKIEDEEIESWAITAFYASNMYTKEENINFNEYGMCETLGVYKTEKIARKIFKEIIEAYCEKLVYEMPDFNGCPFVEEEK